MISERFIWLSDGTIVRRREVQTELAEWHQVSATCWERRVREWGGADGREGVRSAVRLLRGKGRARDGRR